MEREITKAKCPTHYRSKMPLANIMGHHDENLGSLAEARQERAGLPGTKPWSQSSRAENILSEVGFVRL